MKENELLLHALVRDIVELSVQCSDLLEKGTFCLDDFDQVHITNEMCKEIISRFTVKIDNEKN